MALRDRLTGLGRVAATAAADALLDWAETGSLMKAEDPKEPKESADEGQSTAPGGSNADTSKNAPVPTQASTEEPKSLFYDPFSIIEQLGYKEKPTAITYNTLKMIMWRMPIVQAVVQTRINQVASFAKPSHNRYDLGFRVKTRETEKEPSEQDKKWSQQMESLIMRTGITDNPRGRDDMEKFLRKLTWDALVFDQTTFEIVPNKQGQPAEWYAVDASTVRLADTARTYMNEDLMDAVRYVQIYDSMIVSEYTQEEMAFGIRNPRTDIRLHGYGVSELEILIQVITSFLNSWDYNAKFFTQGSAAKGLLNFKGAMNETQLKAFRRHWYQMISGVENAWRTPITNADEVQWLNMQNNNRDMEFNAWMDFLIKLTCSCYQMDPVEVNFQYGNMGQKSSLQQSSNREKITESRERGLRPLLGHLAAMINRNIIWPLNESFEFSFVGLDAFTKEEAAELQTKQIKTYRTVDEIRAEEDLSPLPDGKGEVILDPTWAQLQAQAAQAEMGGEGGFGGDEEGGEGDDGGFDFEKLLGDEDEDEEDTGDDEKKEEKPNQAQSGKPPFQKSMNGSRVVRLDLKL